MLIVPIEKGIDWARAPVVTAALILINCLVYSLWQTNDNEKIAAAVDFYQQSVLPRIEYPIYLSHLHQSQQNQLAQKLETAWQQNNKLPVYIHLITDRSFAAFLTKTDMDFWGEDIFNQWQKDRQTLENMVQSVSTIRLGLIPANDRGLTYFTYQFLHGDAWHLIGNMIFLAVVGMGVEAAIGSFYFVLGYLLSGILAGVFYGLVTPAPYLPLVGASGSISALMGMYAVIYGLHKIRFFYFVIFYFGYFTAPALAILPIWLAIEIFQAIFNTDSYVAYWAHAGGLIAGSALMFAGKKWILTVDEEYFEETDEEQTYREDLNRLMQQLSQFNFDGANKSVTQMLQKYPDDIALVSQQYHLSKLQNDPAKVKRLLERLLIKYSHTPHFERNTESLLIDFETHYPDTTLSADVRLKLLIYLIHPDTMNTAEQMLRSLLNDKVDDPRLLKAIRTLIRYYQDKNDKKALYRYQQLADAVEQQTSAS